MTKEPSGSADLSQWILWVNQNFPHRGAAASGPRELRTLVQQPDRTMAAMSAQLWFSMQRKFISKPAHQAELYDLDAVIVGH